METQSEPAKEMNMVDRVVMAIAENDGVSCSYRDMAIAIIEAMRIPTDDMLDKMNDVWVDAGEVSINVCFADLKEIYAAAIDAALKEHDGA